MHQAEFCDQVQLDIKELSDLIGNLADVCGVCFSLFNSQREPLIACCPFHCENDLPCLMSLAQKDLGVEPCPLGGMRAVAALNPSDPTGCYVVGCVAGERETHPSEAHLVKAVELLRQILWMFVRQALQLEGLGRETLLRYEELNLLYEMGESIISDMSIDEITAHMLERAVETTEAQGGAILLLDESALRVQVSLGWGSEQAVKGKLLDIGDGILGQALAQRQSRVLINVFDDQLYGSREHPAVLDSALCIPLATTARLVGSMILVNKTSGSYFTASDEKLSLAIATQAAIAIENNRLQYRIREEERVSANLQRYVSPNVVRAVLERGGLQELVGDRWQATILFVDIRDFSIIVEQTPPQVMITLLNEYFREMTEIIFRYQGAIDEFAGDQLLAFFGIPLATPKGAENAVRAAVEMVQRMEELRADWRRRGMPAFKIGLGLNTGWVAVGNIGSEKRMELTVIGPPVVIASRIEELNKLYGTEILVTQDTLDEVRDVVTYRDMGEVLLRGISRPVHLYEITGLKDAPS